MWKARVNKNATRETLRVGRLSGYRNCFRFNPPVGRFVPVGGILGNAAGIIGVIGVSAYFVTVEFFVDLGFSKLIIYICGVISGSTGGYLLFQDANSGELVFDTVLEW
nr:hypothetical protein [Candidatus Electrothrix aestuarii]